MTLSLCLGIGISIGLFAVVRGWERARIQVEFEQRVDDLAVAIERSIAGALEVLHSIRAFYDASNDVDRREFRDFVHGALSRNPSIQALSWAPLVPAAARGGHEAALRQDGFPGFQITERDARDQLVRAGARAEYAPVSYIEPLTGNESALGFDLASNAARREALERARDTGAPAATGRIRLVQETGEQFGFLILIPIYRHSAPLETVTERRAALRGHASGVFRIGDMVEASLRSLDAAAIEIRLHDETAPARERLLYIHAPRPRTGTSQPIAGEPPPGEGRLHWRTTLDVAGRQWSLLFLPTSEYLAARRTWQEWGVLGAGLLVTALLGTYLRTASNRAIELVKANEGLEREIAERKRAEEAAETQRREVEAVADIARTINVSMDLDAILAHVAEAAKSLCQADLAWIALREPGSESMVFRHWPGARYPSYQQVRIEPGKGIGGQVLVSGRPFRTADYAEDPRITKDYLDVARAEAVVTALVVPIRTDDRVDGLLYVENRSPRPFADRDEAILGRLADHAAIALQNAGLYAEARQRRREAEGLTNVGRLISQSLDPKEVGQRIVDNLCALFGARMAALYRLVPESEELVLLAAVGSSVDWNEVLPRGTATVGLAIRERRPVATADLLADPRIRFTPESRARVERSAFRAVLAVPLVAQDRVIGALAIGDRAARVFGPDEIRLAQSFADQAAVALDNARLYEAAKDARDFLRSIAENSVDAILTTDVRGRLTYFSPGAEEMFGYRLEDVLGQPISTFFPPGSDDARTVMERLRSDGRLRNYECRFRAKDGRWVEVSASISLLRDARGVVGTLGIIKDVTERRRAEEALRRREEHFRSLIENGLDIITILDRDGRIRYESPSIERVLGYGRDALIGANVFELIHPDDVTNIVRTFQEGVNVAGFTASLEFRFRHADGSWRTLEGIGKNLLDDPAVAGVVVNSRDITLREELEAQLRQSQKMEAVGRLAGGVAHDFNNLLTVIAGRSELLLGDLGPGDPRYRDIALILKTAERAATLTGQLLAFSRKQVLQPKVLDLNAVVASLATMLRRLIGEDIELSIMPGPGLGRVKADPGQLEQVIINLAVNARDAMPQGGRLTIGTANAALDETRARPYPGLEPGSYVALTVRDTGCGMSQETQARIFEPFFTTKGPGKGTGLGLSTVYGIVKQHDGYVLVESEPGKGSAFKVYLPRIVESAESLESNAAPPGPPSGSETVLLVEDEREVRALAADILEMGGYAVLQAANGREAVEICQQHDGPIDLLLTDVVMPEVSGPALVQQVASLRPEMQVLYMSGYTDDAIVHHGVLAPGTVLLQKPFTPGALARKVRDVLDRARDTSDDR